jgi:Uma2 family endonuclease
MAAVEPPHDQCFLLRDLDWSRYRAIADAVGESHLRLTYDCGRLELMRPSYGHQRCSALLARVVGVLTEELDMPRQSGGSTTLNQENLDCALETDQCFYLEHEAAARGKRQIDLATDPPPDLAIEVDVSRSSLCRMNSYARLGVPEVWRFDGAGLRVYTLTEDARYVESATSPHFPFLPLAAVQAFLLRGNEMDETRLVKLFRQRVRELLAGGRREPT